MNGPRNVPDPNVTAMYAAQEQKKLDAQKELAVRAQDKTVEQNVAQLAVNLLTAYAAQEVTTVVAPAVASAVKYLVLHFEQAHAAKSEVVVHADIPDEGFVRV